MSDRQCSPPTIALDLSMLDFDKGGGLVTVVTQDVTTGVVLMVAHADREALERSLATGEMHYRSRTRGLWRKGATSGNTQRLISLTADCDGDAVLARVVPSGAACHTGSVSCFGATALAADALGELSSTVAERAVASRTDVPHSYTRRLLDDENLRLKKLGEEAVELAVAAAHGDRTRAVEEAADLLYHTIVAMRGVGASLDDVRVVLRARVRRSGTHS
jgi:phosphoribosyl-AMP cyclohydrolase / phosphoribosyl-ATP pyrophosphohydrolase